MVSVRSFLGDITPVSQKPGVSFACISPLRILVLFNGTASVERGCRTVVSDCVAISVDNNVHFAPTYLCDVRYWKDHHMADFEPGHFDIIFASPPCTAYRRAKTRGRRDLETADSLVKVAMAIIQCLEPNHWVIENSVSLLHTMPFMQKFEPFMMTC
jgi:site-specific DNA-cytosine methylase